MRAITPNLWFDDNALEAAEFYVSLFPDSRITRVMRYTSAGPGPEGEVVTVEFELRGQPFTGINGGPIFSFDEAISFAIECDDQAESDRYWDAFLADGGQQSQCGWLKDRFGLSWQVYPSELAELTGDPDPERAARATAAMLQMQRIDIEAIRAAADGGSQPAS
ncbi:MAG TPA: VOC family protein [Phycicoccus sp.]|jgi:predicted 3-demethylubiquinone-9 3-methyltransferase (glyoxalase superfamily)|nr:VOC family protein [Phycicoccus sp.]